MSEKKYFIFTDADVDGAGSYLIWKWCTAANAPYITTRINDLPKAVKTWSATHNIDDYDQVYVFDLDASQDEETRKFLDRKNVTIIDHHKCHVDNKHKYKHATVVLQVYTSCTKLLYNQFKNAKESLTDEQKLLVVMVDDYDCYELKVPNSYQLNIVFWNYQGDRLAKFIRDFSGGFQGFKPIQLKAIDFYEQKLSKIKETVHVYTATIPINNNKYRFVSTFASECINDIADFIIKNYKADVGLVVNPKSNKVSVRRSKECDLDLSDFAARLFKVGGGHADAAGGIIDDNFATFSTLFKPYAKAFGDPFKYTK